MAAQEITVLIDWGVVVPSVIAGLSLLISFIQVRKGFKNETRKKVERTIDEAHKALKDCEENLRNCGREKDELRREKFELLQQIARMANPTQPPTNSDGGSEH